MRDRIRRIRPRVWLTALAVVTVLVFLEILAQHQAIPDGPPGATIFGTVTASPVCPVERSPAASACVPRPVAGTMIVVTLAADGETIRSTTAVDGRYGVTFRGSGTITITSLPVRGLVGTPAPVTVTLDYGGSQRVDLEYDTGIR